MAISIIKKLKGFRWKVLKGIQRFDFRLPNREVILKLFRDMKILVRNPRKSGFARDIFLRGVWEKKVTRFAASKIRPGMTVLDIGADIGYYSLLFSKLVGNTGKVFAFEPLSESKKMLDCNVRLNLLDNVETFEIALFDQEGALCLGGPNSKIEPQKKIPEKTDSVVRMQIFDKIKKDIAADGFDFLKIDVEGAEMNVLRGMRGELEKNHPLLLIEMHPKELKSFGYSSKDLLMFLKSFGYEIVPINGGRINLEKVSHIFCYNLGADEENFIRRVEVLK